MSSDLLQNLNKEQKEAVSFNDGPLLIVAGAGTGKTTVITKRIAWLIEQKKARPDEILALTFTDKAAGEMEERVDRLLPYGYVDLWISTFHSFCERILKQHALDIGLSNDFKLLGQTEQWLIVRQNLDKFNLDYYRPLGNPTKFIHALINHFSRCKDEEIAPEDYLKYAEDLKINLDGMESGVVETHCNASLRDDDVSEVKRLEEVANAYHVYQQLLLDNNSMDFGDLINYALKLFRERSNILKKYKNQFKYILVDEFQDTNWAQYELVKLLINEEQNITVVADDDQSIFRWRGASISNVLQFKKDYPKSEQIVLVENYRSRQNILDLAYNFIQLNNPNRLEYQINQAEDLVKNAKDKGIDLSGFKKIDKKLLARTKDEGIIEHLSAETLEDEVDLVIKKIVELKKNDKDVSWSDFAILVRANRSADIFNANLKRIDIPYQFLSLGGLYLKLVILDIINYFKLLDNYHEASALYRIIRLPIFNFSDYDISKMNYYSRLKTLSLYEVLNNIFAVGGMSQETCSQASQLLGFIKKHSQLAREKSISDVFKGFLYDTGYLKFLQKDDTQESRQNLDYLNQFFQRIKEFENNNADARLSDFMEFMELETEAGDTGALKFDPNIGPETVKVMTVHASKGLEFKYVFVVNMVDLRFPTTERRDPIEIPEKLVKEVIPEGDIHLQEERRLFYVACTRAKDGLFFSSAKDYGGARKKKPSRFLVETGICCQEIKKTRNQEIKEDATDRFGDVAEPILAGREMAKKKNNVPLKFSYSQLAAFEKCPKQYKYNFILKIPVFGKAQLSFGQTMHLTLQKFFALILEGGGQSSMFDVAPCGSLSSEDSCTLAGEKNISSPRRSPLTGDSDGALGAQDSKFQIPSLKELLKFYEESWVDFWYKDKAEKEKYREDGKKILKEFYEKLKTVKPKPISLESGFSFKLASGGDIYTVKGKIDRVDEVEGGIEIIDYKTGKSKSLKDLRKEDKEQLLIYQMAALEAGIGEPVKLTYYYLDNNTPVSFVGSEDDMEKLRDKIIDTIDKIKNSDFPANPSMLCDFCDFKGICEERYAG
ncbi:MAG: UvrD-helicase domain-containing protein [bacterium]